MIKRFLNPKYAGIKPAATGVIDTLSSGECAHRPVAAGFMPACFGFRTILIVVIACVFSGTAFADDVLVAAASDLSYAINAIIPKFEQATGHKVKLTLGSSGNFYAQIANGAPFQVFLSADLNYPRQLEKAGKAEPGSTYIYALGKIVFWIPNSSKIDLQTKKSQSLLDPSVRKIAIGNPEHAPYGRAAVEAMRRAGVYDAVKAKLVYGENISQAAQFVQSGAADIGIIALSLALGESMRSSGKYWEVPSDMYVRMEQGAVLVKPANAAARAFHEWMRRPESREVLSRYGFALP
jgi:molybdate transport system substrate-binding protein